MERSACALAILAVSFLHCSPAAKPLPARPNDPFPAYSADTLPPPTSSRNAAPSRDVRELVRPVSGSPFEGGDSAGRSIEEKDAGGGQRIALDFKDADIHNVLRLIADVGRLSIVATDDVEGKVTMHLGEMPWEDALNAVLAGLRLGSRRSGDIIRVSTLKRLADEDEDARRAEDATEAIEPVYTEYLRINYAKASDLAEILRGAHAAGNGNGTDRGPSGLLSPRGMVVVDQLSNTLVVRDVSHGVDNARELVRHLDVPVAQVLIEASIVETAADFGRSLGIQWGYRASIGPQTDTSTGTNFPGTIDAGGSGLGTGAGGVPLIADFPAAVLPGQGSALDLALGSLDGSQALDLRLSALEREGKARIISKPRVVTLSNVAATIKSLTVLRVKLPSTDTIIGGEGEVSRSTATERIETGIILVVTPQVSADGFVLLDLFAKSSQADFTRTVDGIPTETSREASSHVLVANGQTVVLGGIYAEVRTREEEGMPFFRDIPVLSWFFKRVDRSRRREDLLVFLTPRILGTINPALPSASELWQDQLLDGDNDGTMDDRGTG